MERETILLLTKVLENYPGLSTEKVKKAYMDACLEINVMSEADKRLRSAHWQSQSLVDEKIEMIKRFRES